MVDKTKDLVELIKEHPDREVIYMYPCESGCYGDGYAKGNLKEVTLDEYLIKYDRVWLSSLVEESDSLLKGDIEDYYVDELYGDWPSTKEQLEVLRTKVEEEYKQLEWIKCIVVYIHY